MFPCAAFSPLTHGTRDHPLLCMPPFPRSFLTAPSFHSLLQDIFRADRAPRQVSVFEKMTGVIFALLFQCTFFARAKQNGSGSDGSVFFIKTIIILLRIAMSRSPRPLVSRVRWKESRRPHPYHPPPAHTNDPAIRAVWCFPPS